MDLNDMAFDADVKAVADELVEARNENRVNGFAEGDRVQVINEDSRYYSMIGKVVSSWPGCLPGCRKRCPIVHVDLPAKNDKPQRSPVGFVPTSLTHID